VSLLEAAPTSHLSEDERLTYERLIGQAVARDVADKNPKMAQRALDDAEKYLSSRIRLSYLWASTLVSGACALLGLALWLLRAPAQRWVGPGAFDVILGAMAGAVGALLSTLLRLGDLKLDIFTSPLGNLVNGAAPIVAAALGGALVAGAIKANLVALAANNSRALLLVVCAISGTSERLVPSLINKVDVSIPAVPGNSGTRPDDSSAPAVTTAALNGH
jgi:hypothetical protein